MTHDGRVPVFVFRGVISMRWAGLPARRTEIFAPGFGGTVDKMGWVRYTIDEKGTTSKAVPQSELRDNRCFGVLAVISYYLPVKQRQ